jgi:hypothetical protein
MSARNTNATKALFSEQYTVKEVGDNINFNQYVNASQSELSNVIYNTIKAAPPFSTITLPDRHIVLPCIVIKHPMTINGSPGTILEIVNGNVVCDFRAFV